MAGSKRLPVRCCLLRDLLRNFKRQIDVEYRRYMRRKAGCAQHSAQHSASAQHSEDRSEEFVIILGAAVREEYCR